MVEISELAKKVESLEKEMNDLKNEIKLLERGIGTSIRDHKVSCESERKRKGFG
jgi:cell division protein FtsB